jgi:ribosome-associated protein
MSTTQDTAAKRELTKLQRAIIDGLEDVKAHDIQVFDTEHLTPLFERVIIASGTSNRQTKALASSVRESVKQAGFAVPRHEGEDNGEWIIVDCDRCVVHIMQPNIRQYYRLEEIWGGKSVRVKLGGAKVSRRTASEDASAEGEAAAPAARKTVAKKAAGTAATSTTAKTAAKKAPAKKAAAKSAADGTAPDKAPARKRAAPKAGAPVKTVVIKPTTARGAARKPGATRAAAARKA